jgi:hypothetical protein
MARAKWIFKIFLSGREHGYSSRENVAGLAYRSIKNRLAGDIEK